MRIIHYTLFIFIIITASSCKTPAQNSTSQGKIIEIYADAVSNDTVKQIISILQNQLQSSNKQLNFRVFPVSNFKNSGICLVNIASNTQLAIKIPKSQFGVTEKYTITSDEQSVLISGNSNLGLRHGVFAWLEKLGFRYYFPHPDWHIIPSNLTLYSTYSISSAPDYHHRRIFYEYGTGSAKADEDFNFWQMANKLGSTLDASFGHAYDDIVDRNKDIFLNHPEWFYPVPARGVLPSDPKFDMSNENLVQFIIQDVFKRMDASIKKNAPIKMISLGASDGRGTCNTPACQKLGSLTDRVYYLVNRVARAVSSKYPGTYVGCLAYDEYAEPPSIKLEPNIFVAITTAFNSSKYSTEELVKKWQSKGVQIGIYDYFSQFTFDFDIPGQSQASKKNHLIKSINHYYQSGVRGYEGQSSTGWVNKGLGFYQAAQAMWNVHVEGDEIRRYFFKQCFGKAAGTIEQLWEKWEGNGFISTRESDLAKWIDLVSEAERLETGVESQKRIFQIKTYLHYLFLLRKYNQGKTENNLLTLLNYGFRTLDLGSVIGYPAFFELGNRSGIPGMAYDANAKWRSNNNSINNNEITQLLKNDRAQLKISLPVLDFSGTTDFKTIGGLNLSSNLFSDSTQIDNAFWLVDEWVLQIQKKGPSNFIDFTGDYIGDKTVTKPIKLSIYKYSPDGNVEFSAPLMIYDYTAEKVKEKISLANLPPGIYTMIIHDPVKIYRLKFSPSVNYSVVMRPQRQIQTTSLNYAFIYVPEGVKTFNVTKGKILNMLTPTGRQVKLDDEKVIEATVDVLKGEAGLWRIKFLADRLYIEGIPPYLGTSPWQMLIPAKN